MENLKKAAEVAASGWRGVLAGLGRPRVVFGHSHFTADISLLKTGLNSRGALSFSSSSCTKFV
jgi:hypothetical protein